MRWSKDEHRHSAIRFVTPNERHRQQVRNILHQRHAVYQAARARHPERFARHTRCWQPIGDVWLDRERPDPERKGHRAADALPDKAGGGGPMAAQPLQMTA